MPGGQRALSSLERDAVLLGDHLDQVDDAARVPPLVVVPGHKLHKLRVESNAGACVEDGGARVGHKVLGDHGEFRVADHALVGGLGGLLDGRADGLVGCGLGETGREVNHGHVGRGHAKGHAGELALKGGDDLGHGLGGAGGGGNDVDRGRTSAAPVLLGGAVHNHLGGREGVHGGHECLLDAELVVDNLDDGSKAVGRAGGAGQDIRTLVVDLVHAHDNDLGVVLGRRGHDHLLGAAIQMHLARVLSQKGPRGLAQVAGAQLAPADLLGLASVGGLDAVAVDDDVVALHVHLPVEAPVHGVVLELVCHVLGVGARVDGDKVALRVLDGNASHQATNASEAVDAHGDRHVHVVGACVLHRVELEGGSHEGGGGAGQGQGTDEGGLHGGHLIC
ncbi:glyceraldehyde-3-phosphate dehydrogenase [Nannochloropsis gaditana CCMP526]|uniref:glyceraldehyde-3-phosphate dehydrogenase n=1 Tax=Nannochloropsis gaditana (strain CCMP526) TaxID=1093141 RepID=UPI00029F6A00|nr:glyceraldehyde-3-phosphate dehydrogenase [Nannochloropsis gaditana CCMP526]EKU20364.1 glyceraldehyde-3-phosphate dehydrogenase [Nannochloropsis gaditana CCMP526]|eukprot:XP_005856002.1 glyceraldehyde-3-phosphate dehydrogenase [Nannochloropsis gaditana CCMP526]